jgi:hypothetical protein
MPAAMFATFKSQIATRLPRANVRSSFRDTDLDRGLIEQSNRAAGIVGRFFENIYPGARSSRLVTFCSDVCPIELQAMASAIDQLGPAGDGIQPLFITVDPEKDTPDQLKSYVTLFHPRLIGLTGDPHAIKKVALAYKVYYAKSDPTRNAGTEVDHTSFIFLVDPEGKYLGFAPPGTSPGRLAEIISHALAHKAIRREPASSEMRRNPSHDPRPSVAEPRRELLLAVRSFVRAACTCPGVVRIALMGSLVTSKAIPKDADVLVTINRTMDLGQLARAGRRLKGSAQTINLGADIFLADVTGRYLGRICHYRECHPRVACLAQHCGCRERLNDDLQVVTLSKELLAAPPVDLWPNVVRRVTAPADVEALLLTELERVQ